MKEYGNLTLCFLTITFVVAGSSLFHILSIVKEIRNAKREKGVSFFCVYKRCRGREYLCLAGMLLSLLMICVHAGKVVWRNAFIPGSTFLFYGAAAIFFLLRYLDHTIGSRLRNFFMLYENGYYFRGKRSDKGNYRYSCENSGLALYTLVDESMDAIIPEYRKEIEVTVPEDMAEEIRKFLAEHYTKKIEGTGEKEPEKAGTDAGGKIRKAGKAVGIVLACGIASFFVHRGYIVNEWEMRRDPDGIEITGYNGNKTDIVIPDHVGGRKVVGIRDFSDSLLWDRSRVRSVRIPDTVVWIIGDSFTYYGSLEKISITTATRLIDSSSFQGCSALKSMEIRGCDSEEDEFLLVDSALFPSELILCDCSVADGSFYNNTRLETITMTGDMDFVGMGAFENCSSLKTVYLSDSIEEIGDSAFSGCVSLQYIHLPGGLKTIGGSAFSRCGSLGSIDLSDTVENIGEAAFAGSGLTEIAISSDTACIPDKAFENCASLQKVVISGQIETIGESAFSGCGALTELELPAGMKRIGDAAFSGCISLQEIHFPDSVETIGESAFTGSGLRRVSLPSSLQTVPANGFSNCMSLEEVEVAEGCTEIGAYAFHNCENVNRITLPDSLRTLGEAAFYGCPVCSVFLPDNLTQFSDTAFLHERNGIPVFLCYTEACTAADQIAEAYEERSEEDDYNVFALLPVKSREEYDTLIRTKSLLEKYEEINSDDTGEILYPYGISLAEIQTEMLSESQWNGYESVWYYTLKENPENRRTLFFYEDGSGSIDTGEKENFTWKEVATGCIELFMDGSEAAGKEVYATFYTDFEDRLYLVLWDGDYQWFFRKN